MRIEREMGDRPLSHSHDGSVDVADVVHPRRGRGSDTPEPSASSSFAKPCSSEPPLIYAARLITGDYFTRPRSRRVRFRNGAVLLGDVGGRSAVTKKKHRDPEKVRLREVSLKCLLRRERGERRGPRLYGTSRLPGAPAPPAPPTQCLT
ncbi:hypothetical protein EVAR_9094_1 [Eumeta japonica]|uniref:Uncharacterized protein n=1 Tax=Eumeta variegata TaxID=151549 RepID=A0A4C1TW43_EUMVA|nr:hypothetical protein EVAR_9094_1 [Eumeta japonica]